MIVTIILFIVILGLLIFVHELGHFLTAKRSGASVLEFGFGFPPKIFSIHRGGTVYSINWIPVGGFVKIKGEGGEAAGEKDSFSSLATWRRLLIVISGVGMNILLAMILLSFVFAAGAPTALDGDIPKGAVVSQRHIQIFDIEAGSPAERAGLGLGDIIVSVDGRSFTSVTELQDYNAQHENIVEKVTVERNAKQITVQAAPEKMAGVDGAVWGVHLAETGTVRYPWYQALWLGVRTAIVMMWAIIIAFYELLKNLLVHQQLGADVAGPIGIAVLTGQVATLGVVYIVQFIALLSLNLAVVNLVPFPALDGGRAFFLLLEKIRRKKMNTRLEALIHNVGFALLLLFVAFITVRDATRFGGKIFSAIGKMLTGGH